MKVFVLNAGSSTYKGSIYDLNSAHDIQEPIWKGVLDYGFSQTEVYIKASSASSSCVEQKFPKKDLAESVRCFVETSWQGSAKAIQSPDVIDFVGHRIVHGGDKFQKPTLINDEVKRVIRDLYPLAPLHNPANLQGIEILQSVFPHAPHLGVFDTAFHMRMPEYAYTYAIPRSLTQEGIRRYGFHGISHEYCAKRVAEILKKDELELKIVTCHLGNGSSLAAIKQGHSIDTTMGFTPMEGLIMGTRCGSIDPGIILYLLRENKTDLNQLDRLLNYESGLKGICGSSDMREIMEKFSEKEAQAGLAMDMLAHSLVRNIGAMAAVLGGIDVLAFTGGIGENQPYLRERVCSHLEFAGIHLDPPKNAHHKTVDEDISLSGSKAKVMVIAAREDLAIAQACVSSIFNH